jgi:hypothetical protein
VIFTREVTGLARWLAWCSVPAFVIGVLLYPDARIHPMGTGLAVGLVGAGLAGTLWSGQPRLLILVALAAGFLPSATGGFAALACTLILAMMFFGAQRAGRALRWADLALLAVLAWAALSWLVNLGRETDLWSFPLALLMFWAPWILVFLLRANAPASTVTKVLSAWLALILVQLVPALLKPLATGMPGAYLVPLLPLELAGVTLPGHDAISAASDITTGTMTSAHHLGVVAVLGLAYLAALYWRERRPLQLLGAAALGYLLLMADAKHVLLAFLLVGVPAGVILVWRELQQRTRVSLLVVGAALVLGTTAFVGAQVASLVEVGLWQPLVGLASVNPKVQLYARTAAQMKPDQLHTWVGYGPGAFASRAASSRATGALYKEETRLPSFIPPFTPPAYGRTVYDLYTASIVATTRYRSTVLTSPFSSIVGIVAEYGLLGSLLVGAFLVALVREGALAWRDTERPARWRSAGAVLAIAIPLLVVLGLFDSYFEQPDVVMPMAALWLLVLPEGRKGDQPT